MRKHAVVTGLLIAAAVAIGIFAMWPRTVDKATVPIAPAPATKPGASAPPAPTNPPAKQ
jgi:hypothetical protein